MTMFETIEPLETRAMNADRADTILAEVARCQRHLRKPRLYQIIGAAGGRNGAKSPGRVAAWALINAGFLDYTAGVSSESGRVTLTDKGWERAGGKPIWMGDA